MPRRSLRPHLNQIRAWVRQGRTDAWVAHQLEVTVRDIEQFKRQNELVSDEELPEGATAPDYPEEIDLRAEDDALIAAELEAAEAEAERARAETERARAEAAQSGEDEEQPEESEEPSATPTRTRSRRGGRGRSATARSRSSARTAPLEGTFDHGEEGYGLWLDPAVQDNPIYAEHWAGHRPVEVVVEEDRIVIRRVGEDD
jgi:DNA invertase Pin-like site-specific DNA recombinase